MTSGNPHFRELIFRWLKAEGASPFWIDRLLWNLSESSLDSHNFGHFMIDRPSRPKAKIEGGVIRRFSCFVQVVTPQKGPEPLPWSSRDAKLSVSFGKTWKIKLELEK